MSDENEILEQREINTGSQITAFLKDPAILAAFAALDKKYWLGFKTCKSAEEKLTLGAKASALEDLQTDLQALVDTGIRATVAVTRRERTQRR